MSSETNENFSASFIDADSAHIGTINSNDINNSNSLTTGSLSVTDSLTARSNVDVNGNLTVFGRLTANGIKFEGDLAKIEDGHLILSGDLSVNGGAEFSFNTLIGSDVFGSVTEGVVSANNLRASNRLLVGDSPFEINAIERRVKGDRFTATFFDVISDKLHTAIAELEKLSVTTSAVFKKATIETLLAEDLKADKITTNNFVSSTSFGVKNDLTVGGSIRVGGGVVIDGANTTEGSLVVNNLPATFNRGISVNHKSGTLTQTLTVIGTSETTGTTTAETEENKYAVQVAPGVRSLFRGDVVVRDSKLILQDSVEQAEEIQITKIRVSSGETPDKLTLLKSGSGFDAHLATQVTYEAQDEDDIAGEAAGRTAEDIRRRGAVPYVGKAVDITSAKPKESPLTKRSNAKRHALREISIAALTRKFTVGSSLGGSEYRIDAGGNILAKKAVIETAQFSSVTANKIVAGTVEIGNFSMDNVSVTGVVSADSGVSIGGDSEISGTVYDYAHTTHKDDSSVAFVEQSTATFKNTSTLKIEQGARFIADEDSEVTMQGTVEINMKNLILFDSDTGKRYRFKLRDAVVGTEADGSDEVAMEFSEIVSAQDPDPEASTTVGSAAKTRRQLSAELVEFQEKLKRI